MTLSIRAFNITMIKHDTQDNDTHHKDIQHKIIKHETQHNDTHHKGIQHNNN
jgi:hypothetical protein